MYPYGIMKTPDYHTFYNVHDMLDKLEELEQQTAALVGALERVLDEVFPNKDSWGELLSDELISKLEALAEANNA